MAEHLPTLVISGDSVVGAPLAEQLRRAGFSIDSRQRALSGQPE
jgi:hypothetical protein